ncbi:MAG TPA: M20 family metallopeptidase, partial [Anaerolineales bacterium]|nr:M20 family metallopeptidase [Anaerolineales bacterium]
MINFLNEALGQFEYTQALRRDFHRFPELGFQEVRTAGIVAGELNKLGLEVTTGIAQTGVIALLEGARPGPVVLLRFDMDALPIHEETGAEYASQNPGVMHACGHDAHTAIGLSVARLLHAHSQELAGTVKFVFQPAEEGLGGASRMVEEGVLEAPKPDYALALHMWNEKPVGWLGVNPGPIMSASETFRVRLVGKGGHGALPHRAVDPVLAAAQIVSALQSVPARNVSPLDSAVISVTAIHGGEAFNVIPPEVEMRGTIRSFAPDVRQLVLDRFEQVVNGVAAALGCQAFVELKSITPAVINDAQLSQRVQQVANQFLADTQIEANFQTMGSEDMAFLMEGHPSCYFFVG